MSSNNLIYQKSKAGRVGYTLPRTETSPEAVLTAIPQRFLRRDDAKLPEISESEVMRHFVALSVKNHHIEKGFYPLGSCTMKYNPKVNDRAASIPEFANQHPLTPESRAAGSLELMYLLAEDLKEISGFGGMSLQPVAGAQGEFVGLLIMRAYHADQRHQRDKIIVPDSSHGTNPASVSALGWKTITVKSNSEGVILPEAVAEVMDETVAGMMTTNPNTLGLFETHCTEIADIVHQGGGLMYMDGANLNAHMGIFRPADIGFDIMHFNLHKTFSTPHGGGGPGAGAVGVIAELEKYLPTPVVAKNSQGEFSLNYERPDAIGRLTHFFGNFGNMVRAYAYIRALGGEGLTEASRTAILNANYLKALLAKDYDVPYPSHNMHEFVISGSRQKKLGVKTLDISKRLLDFGVHAPTNYFPLIVPEAMMIEPTETENRETLDRFAEVMIQIAREAETDPERVTQAPYDTPVRRLDEATAARALDVNYPAE